MSLNCCGPFTLYRSPLTSGSRLAKSLVLVNSPNLSAYFLMASSKLLSQPRWFQFLPRNLCNVRLFSDLPSQHPVSVSEPQNNIDSKSNNRFNKASSTPSSLKEPELAKFSAIADTWSVKYGIFFSSIQQ